MTFWAIPQKLAGKPPARGSGEYPMIFCWRCEIPVVVMVRRDTSPNVSEWLEERNRRCEIYVVLPNKIEWDLADSEERKKLAYYSTRMRLQLCGECVNDFGPNEFDMVLPMVISGIESFGKEKPHIAQICEEYSCCRLVKIEGFDEAHRNVNAIMKESEERSKKAILDEILRDREMRAAMAQIQGKVRGNDF